MSGSQSDNVVRFPSGAAAARAAPEAEESAGETSAEDDGADTFAASDLRAMAECLQYLYHESNRLDATTTSRLIGAAAMAVAEDIRERESSR